VHQVGNYCIVHVFSSYLSENADHIRKGTGKSCLGKHICVAIFIQRI